jgi:outer membrane immunogenic protein
MQPSFLCRTGLFALAVALAQPAAATDLVVKAPLNAPPPWSGFYFGTTFGGALTRSKIDSSETYKQTFTATPPNNIFGNSTLANSSGNNHGGAMLDALVGTNALLGSSFLLGAQLEGTVSDINFDSSGTRSLTYFNGAGPTGNTASGDWRPHVYSRWMVSALARAGFLVEPATLVYAIGGWTGASFEYHNLTDNPFFEPGESFWANGVSVGGGLERKLNPNWSVRVEYRYTHFQNKSVSNDFKWTSNFPDTQTDSIRATFHNEMHVIRFGVAYLFPVTW